MADHLPQRAPQGQGEGDEAAHVLNTLQGLIATVTSPVLKTCLEEAHADISHLTGPEDSLALADEHCASS